MLTLVQIQLCPLLGVPWFRQGTRNVTETCLDKQTIDAKTSDTAANNIVAFSRTRELATA
ncbi:MAG: hypothetical protein CML44_03495 [Rhodobacteraceae bacterium]|nr:hypothetical protein [Paracoccaceae bacterium]